MTDTSGSAKKASPETLLEAEDEIITYFCELHGGLEFAMPMVQTQIKRVGIDFQSPTREQLKKLVEHLTDITRTLKSEKTAKQEYRHFMRIIRSVDGTDG